MEGKVKVICPHCGHMQELVDEDLLNSVHFISSNRGVWDVEIDYTCEECSNNSKDDMYVFHTSKSKQLPKYYLTYENKILKQEDL